MEEQNIWRRIAEYVRHTPSPHNTQPYRLHVISDTSAEIVFLPSRGLFIADPEGRFTWLTAGIFAELVSIVAHSLGYEIVTDWDFSPMYPNGDTTTEQVIAKLELQKHDSVLNDLNPTLILNRHTSRLPYDGNIIPTELISKLHAEAERYGHRFMTSTKPKDIEWVKELNKNSLFYDLENIGIREELKHWLRYSKKEAVDKKDGLSAECLGMPGRLLHSFFYHHKIWAMPGLKQIVERIYMSTMKGIGTIGWLQGPYATRADWVKSGELMIRLWLILTEAGVYWHPYGSVITNDKSRADMLRHMGLHEEADGKNMIWLLLRMGYSKEPPHSERLALEEIILDLPRHPSLPTPDFRAIQHFSVPKMGSGRGL
ncbi:MAG: hypothetical protein V4702_03325 [Patescibacteria group bacterium]